MSYLMKSTTLPVAKGEAIIRCFVEGMTVSEAAKYVDVTTKTVQLHYSSLVERYKVLFCYDRVPITEYMQLLADPKLLFERMSRHKSFATDEQETYYAQTIIAILHHMHLVKQSILSAFPNTDPLHLEDQAYAAATDVICEIIRRSGPLNSQPEPDGLIDASAWFSRLLDLIVTFTYTELDKLTEAQLMIVEAINEIDQIYLQALGYDPDDIHFDKRYKIAEFIRKISGIRHPAEKFIRHGYMPQKDRRRRREEEKALTESLNRPVWTENEKHLAIWDALFKAWDQFELTNDPAVIQHYTDWVERTRKEGGIVLALEEQVERLYNEYLEFQQRTLRHHEKLRDDHIKMLSALDSTIGAGLSFGS